MGGSGAGKGYLVDAKWSGNKSQTANVSSPSLFHVVAGRVKELQRGRTSFSRQSLAGAGTPDASE